MSYSYISYLRFLLHEHKITLLHISENPDSIILTFKKLDGVKKCGKRK